MVTQQDGEDTKATGSTGRKQNLILRRYWEILNLYPKITDERLAERIEQFTLNATPEQLLRMQKLVIGYGADYMAKDPRWRKILEKMDGEKVGLAIGREYSSTVSLNDYKLEVEMGIEDDTVPVLSVASRQDYVDALLRRKDIIKMLITRKLKATRKLTLVRWGLSFFDLIKDQELFDDLVTHQAVAEKAIAEVMKEMDF